VDVDDSDSDDSGAWPPARGRTKAQQHHDGDDVAAAAAANNENNLRREARMLQKYLDAIVELPKDEILVFLTSSSFPARLLGSIGKSPRSREPLLLHTVVSDDYYCSYDDDDRHHDDGDTSSTDGDSSSNELYNWILHCDDRWADLPGLVRLNAIEMGYTEALWNENSQDLPIFGVFWDDLKPNERTAAIFLGGYSEDTWDEDVERVLEHIDNDNDNDNNHPPPKEPSVAVADSAQKTTVDPDGNNNDDDNDIFREFVANFLTETNEENADDPGTTSSNNKKEDTTANDATQGKGDTRHDKDDEERMMAEFISNFVEPKEGRDGNVDKNDNESHPETQETPGENENCCRHVVGELLSNLVVSGEGNDANHRNDDATNTNALFEDEDDERTTDEFVSDSVTTPEEGNADSGRNNNNNNNDNNKKAEISATMSSAFPRKDENNGSHRKFTRKETEEDQAMMDEFVSNFLDPSEESDASDSNSNSDSEEEETLETTANTVPRHDTKRKNASNETEEDQAMMDEFVSNFLDPSEESDTGGSNNNCEEEEETRDENANAVRRDDKKKIDVSIETKEDQAMMDEFVSNFLEPAEEHDTSGSNNSNNNICKEEKISESTATVLPRDDNTRNDSSKETEEERAMMEEFVSNFLSGTEDQDTGESNSHWEEEEEQLVDGNNVVPKAEHQSPDGARRDTDEDEKMFLEFVSNFATEKEALGGGSGGVNDERNGNATKGVENERPTENDTLLVAEDANATQKVRGDEGKPPVPMPNNNRTADEPGAPVGKIPGHSGDSNDARLLSSSEKKNESQSDEPPPPGPSGSRNYSYLCWIPVIVAVPIVIVLVNRSQRKGKPSGEL